MTDWLLDTNVVSELRRARPSRKVVEFIDAQPFERMFVSAVTLAEIRFGIEALDDPLPRAELLEWLSLTVRPMFDGRVLQVTEDVLVTWRLLMAKGRREGHTFAQPDLIIASVAIENDMTVVTRNVADFVRVQVLIFNPWTDV